MKKNFCTRKFNNLLTLSLLITKSRVECCKRYCCVRIVVGMLGSKGVRNSLTFYIVPVIFYTVDAGFFSLLKPDTPITEKLLMFMPMKRYAGMRYLPRASFRAVPLFSGQGRDAGL